MSIAEQLSAVGSAVGFFCSWKLELSFTNQSNLKKRFTENHYFINAREKEQ